MKGTNESLVSLHLVLRKIQQCKRTSPPTTFDRRRGFANRFGGRYTASAQLCRRLCLLRQLSHRSEACSDCGCRGDDNHSPSGSWRGQTRLDRTAEQFDLPLSRLVADGGYGSADMVGWLVEERGIEPHVKLIDKAERTDGTFYRSDFVFDPESNLYVCPGAKELRKYHRAFAKPRDGLTKDGTMIFFARKHDCEACALKPKCCRTFLRAKSRAPFMKPLVTRPARSQGPRPTPSHAERGRRSRCCSLI